MAKKNKVIFDYQFINGITKIKTVKTFIDVEPYGFKINLIYSTEEEVLKSLFNKLTDEQKQLLIEEKERNNLDIDDINLVDLSYFLDYEFYTLDNNLKKYEVIITQKPSKEDIKSIFNLAGDLLDDILERKGYDIPTNPSEDRLLRNELSAYIGQKIWDFCENKI